MMNLFKSNKKLQEEQTEQLLRRKLSEEAQLTPEELLKRSDLKHEVDVLMKILCQKMGLDHKTMTGNQFLEKFSNVIKEGFEADNTMKEQIVNQIKNGKETIKN